MMTAADNQEYIPRNLMDHMNPYFAKQHHHHHAHSHGHHSHSHSHNHSHHYHPHNHISTSSNQYPTPTPSTCNSGLQTPVPRRSSIAHTTTDPLLPSATSSKSYNTPPATPPLSFPQTQIVIPGLAVPASPASSPSSSATTTTNTGSTKEPVAWCTARARIPTPDGSEYFLHIYENSQDKKEHLAFVFGDVIRSRSLDKVQPNETEMDRVKRGAYTGRLQPIAAAVNAVHTDVDHSLTTLPLFQAQEQKTTTATILSADNSTTTTTTTTTMVTAVATSTTTAPTLLEQGGEKEDTVMTSVTPSTPLVRIHSECFTGEIGHSARCDCGEQLDEAIRRMKEEGAGVVVYLRQEGRGIGLGEKIKAYNLQDLGYDTVMANLLLNHGADERTYEVAQGILEDLGLDQIRLLTNNPDKIEQIERDSQIRVIERVPMMPKSWEAIELGNEAVAAFEVKEGAVENKIVKGKELDRYLKIKVERMRHLIPIPNAL